MSELELLLVNEARKANPDLHRRTDGEILQMFKDNQMPDGQTDDIDMTYAQDDFNVEPQYRIRDQLTRDFLEGGIFKDAYKGLGETKDAFLEDIGGVTKGLGSLAGYVKDKGIDLFGSGKDIALRGIGSIVAGPIGSFIGSAIGKMKTTPEQRLLKDFYEKETGLDSIGRIQGGIMQGYNPVSMFGPQGLTSAIDKRLSTILKTEQKKKAKGLELSKKLIERRKQLE